MEPEVVNLDKSIEELASWPKNQITIESRSIPEIAGGLWEFDWEKMNQLLRGMSCGLCARMCPPRCFSCEEGHLLCGDCYSVRIERCCVPVYGKDGSRSICLNKYGNFHMEMFSFLHESLVKMDFRCENFKYGCKEDVKPELMREHRSNCEYRPIIGCPFTDCQVGELTPQQLIEHLKQSHGTRFETLEPSVPKKIPIFFQDAPEAFEQKYSWTPVIYSYFGYNMLLTMELEADLMHIWFYRLERQRKPSHVFTIEMKLFGQDEEYYFKMKCTPKDFSRPRSRFQPEYVEKAGKFMSDFVSSTRVSPNTATVEVKICNSNGD